MKMSSGKSSNSDTNILVFTAEYNNPQSSPKIENLKVVKWNFCETLCKIQDTVQKGEWHSYTNFKRMLARYLEQTQLEKHCNSREKELVRLNSRPRASRKEKAKELWEIAHYGRRKGSALSETHAEWSTILTRGKGKGSSHSRPPTWRNTFGWGALRGTSPCETSPRVMFSKGCEEDDACDVGILSAHSTGMVAANSRAGVLSRTMKSLVAKMVDASVRSQDMQGKDLLCGASGVPVKTKLCLTRLIRPWTILLVDQQS